MRSRDRYREDKFNEIYLGKPTGRTVVQPHVFLSEAKTRDVNNEALKDFEKKRTVTDFTQFKNMIVKPAPHYRIVPTFDTISDGVPTYIKREEEVHYPKNQLVNPYLRTNDEQYMFQPRDKYNDRLCQRLLR